MKRRTKSARVALSLAIVALLSLLGACDELGNPGAELRKTQPETWTNGQITLETFSLSVPPTRSNELLRAIAPSPPHHLDTEARAAGAVTLVVVIPDPALAGARGIIPLSTSLAFADGSIVRRVWSAPAGAPRYYAGFAVPSWPTRVVTTLAR